MNEVNDRERLEMKKYCSHYRYAARRADLGAGVRGIVVGGFLVVVMVAATWESLKGTSRAEAELEHRSRNRRVGSSPAGGIGLDLSAMKRRQPMLLSAAATKSTICVDSTTSTAKISASPP